MPPTSAWKKQNKTNLKLILIQNKPFSPGPANMCPVALTHPYPVAKETWSSWTLFSRGGENGEMEKVSVQYGL